MPLPDERPRQSVANLIGRFENQTKRQSLSSVPPRSSSVVSHTTGDSVKEEVKEKREWPPKSLPSDATPPPPIIPSSSWSRQSQSPPASQALSPLMVTPDMPSKVAVSTVSDLEVATPNTAKPSAAPQKQANSGNSERLAQEPTTTNARPSGTSTRTSAPKPVTSPPSRTLVKPSVKSTPRPPPSATVSQPLKPQHTGQSTTSTTSTRKPVTKAAPTTPARPKTPSRTATNASHANTPTASRPKTPSTGLFAPTAASLARARNAQPQPPTPTKKTTISSGSSDRLSKPTAASLSKARSPPVASPSAKPTAHGTPTRGVPKPKATSLSTRPKKDASLAIIGGTGASAAAAVAAVGMIAALDAEDIPDETSEEDQNHGLEPPTEPLPSQEDEVVEGNVGVTDEAEVHEELVEEVETHEEIGDEGSGSHEVHEEPEPLEEENITPQGTTVDSEPSESAEAASPEAEQVEMAPTSEQVEASPAETEAAAEVNLRSTPEVEEDAPVSTSEPEPEAAAEPKALAEVAEKDQAAATTHTSPPVFSGNNIEDIVNLLESVPIKLRPEIPDEVHEIPDEE